MNSTSPYISFIGFARNDDYIPDRAEKHNFSLNFLLQQLKDYEIPSEIILVEWNYPQDRPPLAETIRLTVETKWTTVRVVRVRRRGVGEEARGFGEVNHLVFDADVPVGVVFEDQC